MRAIVRISKGGYIVGMEYGRLFGIILVVGFIGPLFWLGVQTLEAKFWLFLRNRRHAKQAADTHTRLK